LNDATSVNWHCWRSVVVSHAISNLDLRASHDESACRGCDHAGVSRTVLIVDDHAGFRRSARALLDADGFRVVGEAADGQTALTEAARLRPEVVLLDIQLPDVDGFAVAKELADDAARPIVILISSRDRASYRGQLENAPVAGFIAKSDLTGRAIRAVTG
jgi:DNA-binding NarL/FixJ family response regulator